MTASIPTGTAPPTPNWSKAAPRDRAVAPMARRRQSRPTPPHGSNPAANSPPASAPAEKTLPAADHGAAASRAPGAGTCEAPAVPAAPPPSPVGAQKALSPPVPARRLAAVRPPARLSSTDPAAAAPVSSPAAGRGRRSDTSPPFPGVSRPSSPPCPARRSSHILSSFVGIVARLSWARVGPEPHQRQTNGALKIPSFTAGFRTSSGWFLIVVLNPSYRKTPPRSLFRAANFSPDPGFLNLYVRQLDGGLSSLLADETVVRDVSPRASLLCLNNRDKSKSAAGMLRG